MIGFSKRLVRVLGVLFVSSLGGAAFGQEIFTDPFNYADTAAMNAVWGRTNALGTLDTARGNTGSSIAHPGGVSNERLFAAVTPTDDRPLVYEFDFYNELTGNKRLSGGLRAGSSAIIEMGWYNAAAEGSGFAYRTALQPGATNWHLFPNAAETEGWHHFKATVKATSIIFELDLGDDGTVDSSATEPVNSSTIAYDRVRIGGPSDLSSAGGGGNWDNVTVSIVPEPASLGSLALGAMLMVGRRRRK